MIRKEKNMMKKNSRIVLVMLAVTFLIGCGKTAEPYGEQLSLSDKTAVGDILTEPAKFEGKNVRLEGNIGLECSTGCWFELKEGNAVIFVDLKGAGVAIPQEVGSKVVAEGKIAVVDGRITLNATGLEIK
jgi:hypothetical protein